jgi:hypothetical protein
MFDDRYYPSIPWGFHGANDYPTVKAHQTGTKSSIMRRVDFADGTTYNLPNANGVWATDVDKFWTGQSENDCYLITHNKGAGANWIYGHQGPASSGTVTYSFQRNVIGFSYHYETGNSNSAGLSPKNMILLYRDKRYTDRFMGAWLIKDSDYPAYNTQQHFGNKLFDDIPTYLGTRKGRISMNVGPRNSSYEYLRTGDLCFQGIWFEMRTNDNSGGSGTAPYKIFKTRLIYDDVDFFDQSTRVESTRIVLPCNMKFQDAYDRSKPLRLT